MSLFHTPPANAMALVFGGVNWVYDRESDVRCSKGGTGQAKMIVQFPLPQPPLDPIPVLTGHGHEAVTGPSNCRSTDVDVTFTRTGD